jgi:dihydrofolate synthase/folylpolyglutamate synthase
MPQTIDSELTSPARQAVLDWLLGRINFERTAFIPYQERQLKLDRMRQLLTRLGQPDAALKIIHVAGTKGKGSTSAMIAAMLTAAGYRTGVFSSPHLERIEERFAVDGQPCSSDELVSLVGRLRPIVEAMDAEAAADGDPTSGPTYFDVTTAMALIHFVERQVDAAVLEVGLGGRLDSTNVCLPAVSVITSISFDHMKQLGNTLAEIAGEKAGIIKPGVPVISGVTQPEPQAVVAEAARQHGCRLIQRGVDFRYSYTSPERRRQGDMETRRQGDPITGFSLSPCPPLSLSNESHGAITFAYSIPGQELLLQELPLAMRGPHQAANAAVALATMAELKHQGWCISTEAMRTGLSQATLAGRVEVVAGEPTVVLDTAHNPASARALVESLAEMPAPSRRTLVLSVSSDKDVRAIVAELVPHFERFIITQYQENPRAVDADTLAQFVHAALGNAPGQVHISPTPHEAWQHVCQTAIPHEQVCITGSFYLTAEMRRLVLKPVADATPG